MKRYLLAAAGAVAAALAIGAVANQDAGASAPMYEYFYYSDASKTTMVGWQMDQCLSGSFVVPGPVNGQQTQWFDRMIIGRCPGQLF